MPPRNLSPGPSPSLVVHRYCPLAAIGKDNPPANSVLHLAYVMLAFAMLQEDDRFILGEAFIGAFPEYAEKL